jgi:hypothetical protein
MGGGIEVVETIPLLQTRGLSLLTRTSMRVVRASQRTSMAVTRFKICRKLSFCIVPSRNDRSQFSASCNLRFGSIELISMPVILVTAFSGFGSAASRSKWFENVAASPRARFTSTHCCCRLSQSYANTVVSPLSRLISSNRICEQSWMASGRQEPNGKAFGLRPAFNRNRRSKTEAMGPQVRSSVGNGHQTRSLENSQAPQPTVKINKHRPIIWSPEILLLKALELQS